MCVELWREGMGVVWSEDRSSKTWGLGRKSCHMCGFTAELGSDSKGHLEG